MKSCKGCNKVKSLTDFGLNKIYKDKHEAICKECMKEKNKLRKEYKAAWYLKNKDAIEKRRQIRYSNPDVRAKKSEYDKTRYNCAKKNSPELLKIKKREEKLKYRYGISSAEFRVLFEAQGGKCAICEKTETEGGRFVVDHCHHTDLVRGILCSNCNSGIGFLKEDLNVFLGAIDYLIENNTNEDAV